MSNTDLNLVPKPICNKEILIYIGLLFIGIVALTIYLFYKLYLQEKSLESLKRENKQHIQDRDVEDIVKQYISNPSNKGVFFKNVQPIVGGMINSYMSSIPWHQFQRVQPPPHNSATPPPINQSNSVDVVDTTQSEPPEKNATISITPSTLPPIIRAEVVSSNPSNVVIEEVDETESS